MFHSSNQNQDPGPRRFAADGLRNTFVLARKLLCLWPIKKPFTGRSTPPCSRVGGCTKFVEFVRKQYTLATGICAGETLFLPCLPSRSYFALLPIILHKCKASFLTARRPRRSLQNNSGRIRMTRSAAAVGRVKFEHFSIRDPMIIRLSACAPQSLSVCSDGLIRERSTP